MDPTFALAVDVIPAGVTDSGLLIAITVGFFGIVGPIAAIVGSILTARMIGEQQAQARKDDAKNQAKSKQEDWDRQDKVADAVLNATRVAAQDALHIKGELKGVYHLVNSAMTDQKQATLDQTKLTLVSLQELVDDKKARGVSPGKAATDLIAATEAQIIAMTAEVAQRRETDALAAKEAASAKAAAVASTQPMEVIIANPAANPAQVVIANPEDQPVPVEDVKA